MLPDLNEDDERYAVRDRLEILAAVRGVVAARQPVSVHWDAGPGAALSVVLEARQDPEELILDCPVDAQANRSLVETGRMSLVAHVDGVRLELVADGVEPAVWQGRPALRARMPERMLRLQRRESFRVPAALRCQLALDDQGRVRVLEPRVADISLGGVALVTERNPVNLEPGQKLEVCRIPLGTQGTLCATLEVRSAVESRTASGARQVRLGCRFVDLPPQEETLLARFIAQLQRNRKT